MNSRIEIITTFLFALSFSAFAESTYIVRKGETLYSISRRYNTSVEALSAANNLADGAVLKVGQSLIIPAQTSSSTYTVQKGDTWYGISRKYHLSVTELLSLNGKDSSAGLKIGQEIIVPDKKETTVPQPVTPVPELSTTDPHHYSTKKGDSSLIWPVVSPTVTYVDGKVSGVKLSARENEPVTAIRAGTVMFSGSYRGFGNVVFIQSKTGHIYAYTGLGSVAVTKGDYIVFGDKLGTAGIDSYTNKPQVSLMVFENGVPIDPAKAPRG